jgi:uncharacterized protein with PQ loop repeat
MDELEAPLTLLAYGSFCSFLDSFYFWCMIPQVSGDMDGCPDSDVNVLYMTLSAFIGLFLFLIYQILKASLTASRTKKSISKKNKLKDAEFRDLQIELYGEDRLKDSLSGTNHSASQRDESRTSVVNDENEEAQV